MPNVASINMQLLHHACNKFANPDAVREHIEREVDAQLIDEPTPKFAEALREAILMFVFEP